MKRLKLLILTLSFVGSIGVFSAFAMEKGNVYFSNTVNDGEDAIKIYKLLEDYNDKIRNAKIQIQILKRKGIKDDPKIMLLKTKVEELNNKIYDIQNSLVYDDKIDKAIEEINIKIVHIEKLIKQVSKKIFDSLMLMEKLDDDIYEINEKLSNLKEKENEENLKNIQYGLLKQKDKVNETLKTDVSEKNYLINIKEQLIKKKENMPKEMLK